MAKKTKQKPKADQTSQKPKHKKEPLRLEDCIEPLYMDGLQGRMLRLPPPPGKKREILLIYGHHASLERLFGMAQFLNRYGGVTMPDLPGFGGMEPFYKLRQKPTLDNFADYLAAFVKLRYKRKRVTIMGLSFGFLVVTRMLQRYPELAKKVDLLVSFVGFVHKEDFKVKGVESLALRSLARLWSWAIPSWIFKHIIFKPWFIRFMYKFTPNHAKFKDADEAERKARIDFEVYLWQCNDIRTQGYTGVNFSKVDLCNAQVDLPVCHVAVDNDHYFDNEVVKQHLGVIYKSVDVMPISSHAHAPTVIADIAAVMPFIPSRLRRILNRD
jgi:pimeloyl-ACP methyl ester carboxylesterase